MTELKKRVLANMTPIRKFALLLLSRQDNQEIPGNLWYQKELFLLSKVFEDLGDETNFEPHLFGPHSELAEEEMEELVQLGVVKRSSERGNNYSLTPLGKEIADEVSKKSSQKEIETADEIKEFLNDLNREELLTYIYGSYPAMTEESIASKPITQKRHENALRLYQKGKVSFGKAAELAGMHVGQFAKFLHGKGIKVDVSV